MLSDLVLITIVLITTETRPVIELILQSLEAELVVRIPADTVTDGNGMVQRVYRARRFSSGVSQFIPLKTKGCEYD